MNEHPTPRDMARVALPDDKDYDARHHFGAGVEAERARLLAILRDLDKGDWLPGRLRNLVASLEAAGTCAGCKYLAWMGGSEGAPSIDMPPHTCRKTPMPPEVCPFCKSPAGFGNYHGMLYATCSAEACRLRMVLVDGEWKPDPDSGTETARIWASNPHLGGS